MEKILHALYTPSGSEMLVFAGQVYQLVTGMPGRKKRIVTYKKLSSCLFQDYAGGGFAWFRQY